MGACQAGGALTRSGAMAWQEVALRNQGCFNSIRLRVGLSTHQALGHFFPQENEKSIPISAGPYLTDSSIFDTTTPVPFR
jgi:hypothetical protein